MNETGPTDTLSSSPMSRRDVVEELKDYESQQTNKLLKWIVGMVGAGTFSIILGGIAWGTLTHTVSTHAEELSIIKPQVNGLEVKVERISAISVTTAEVAAMDKRLQRVEDQNAAILQQLEHLNAKLP